MSTVAWSRDGRRLASGGGYMDVEDTSVVVWDVAAAQPEAILVVRRGRRRGGKGWRPGTLGDVHASWLRFACMQAPES